MNAIDDMPDAFKPKVSVYYELQNIMRSILMDLNGVEKQVNMIEMRFNPKPLPVPEPPKRAVSQKPSPTRNYFPPGYPGANQVHFDDGSDRRGVLKQNNPNQAIALQPSVDGVSEYGGTASHYSNGRASSAHYGSQENLSSYRGQN